MSKLFKTMKVDLELKGYSPKTVDSYLRYTKKFLDYYQKPIEQLHTDEIRNYLHHLIVIKKCSHSYVVDIFHIQKLLGHASLKTNARYIHLTRKDVIEVKSPFDMMDIDHND